MIMGDSGGAMLGLNIDVRHGIRAEPIEHSIPDRNMMKDSSYSILRVRITSL